MRHEADARISAMPAAHEEQPAFEIRAARPVDAEDIVRLIRALAVYEKLEHLVQATPEAIGLQLFGPKPAAEAAVVETDTGLVGFALFFHNFSTFLAKPGLYLEDLFVEPAMRGHGIGQALLVHLAQLAVARGCGRFEWSVLNWNHSAIGFYERMGAVVMPEWRICRITGETLERLGAPPSSG